MSILQTLPKTEDFSPHAEDPFYLGHRFVTRVLPDGTEITEQVPLTPYDVLHPKEGYFIVTRDPHDNDRIYLKIVARNLLKHDPTAVVLSDYGLDLNLPDIEPVCPDLMIILGLRERKRPGGIYYIADEGVIPVLVGEITSPETRSNDLGIKVDYYYQAGIPWYIIVDHKDLEKKGLIKLLGYRHEPGGYAEMTPNEKGWLWIEPVKHWLGVEGKEVRFFDPLGKPIGDYLAIARSLEEADAKVMEATRATEEAEARRKEAEARAATESKLRQALEQRLRELEEKMPQASTGG